jgi:sugar/nucleoside kinase (ribokinase family)
VCSNTGENAIVLLPGANRTLQTEWLSTFLTPRLLLAHNPPAKWLLFQNETVPGLVQQARRLFVDAMIVLNPAPAPATYSEWIDLGVDNVDVLVMNEGEAAALYSSIKSGVHSGESDSR